MRLRHALVLSLAAASLLLTAAAPVPGTLATPGVVVPSAGASSSVPVTSAADAQARAGDAIVAMVSGPQRTGSAVVVAKNLVVTSTHVVKGSGSTVVIMTVGGDFVHFEKVAEDKRLGLVLLRAPIDSKPVQWGSGKDLIADQKVTALGIGSVNRQLVPQDGIIQSASFANGGSLMITSIKIDPLVEGGALISPDGKVVGVIVSRGQGAAGGQLGWAVTSEAVRSFVRTVQARQEAEQAAVAQKRAMRWVAWTILLTFVGMMVLAGRAFRGWYKRMEAREEAAMAAEEAERRALEEAARSD